METETTIVEQDSSLTVGQIITVCAGIALAAVAVKNLAGWGLKKLADRKETVVAVETDTTD